MIIGTKEMAELYGKPSVAAFNQHKWRHPEQVPPPAMGKSGWLKEDVIQFLRDKPWQRKQNKRGAGRKRNSDAELRLG